MLATSMKRRVSDSIEIVEGPSPKKSRVVAPSPAPSDNSPNAARPKRGLKPSKRLGTPEPLTRTPPRPKPRPIAKNGVLRTSLPTIPRPSGLQKLNASSQKISNESPVHAGPSQPAVTPHVAPGNSSSRAAINVDKPNTSASVPSKTPSPKKKQTPLTIFLPSKSRSGLPEPPERAGSASTSDNPDGAFVVPTTRTPVSSSPKKRKARASVSSSSSISPRKSPKKKKPRLSETVIELFDSEEEPAGSKLRPPKRPPTSVPAVIDLCSDEEPEPEPGGKVPSPTTPTTSGTSTQRRTTPVAGIPDRPPTPDENRAESSNDPCNNSHRSTPIEVHEVPDLTRSLSPIIVAETSQTIELERLGRPSSDVKDPMIYPSDDRELASSPSPQIDSEDKDKVPVSVVPPSSPQHMADSMTRTSPSRLETANLSIDFDDDSSNFYVPSPIPDDEQEDLNSLTEIIQAQVQTEKVHLFLPADSDDSQGNSDTLPIDSQTTQFGDPQEVVSPEVTAEAGPAIPEYSVMNHTRSGSPPQGVEDTSLVISPSTMEQNSSLGQDQFVPGDSGQGYSPEPVPVDIRDDNEVEEAADGNAETLYEAEDIQFDYEVFSEPPQTSSAESTPMGQTGFESSSFHTMVVASAIEGDNTALAGLKDPPRPRRDSKPAPRTIDDQVSLGSKSRKRRKPTIVTSMKHAASNGPGTPSVYDPVSMPPLLTPRFFAQSCLPPRSPVVPASEHFFPILPSPRNLASPPVRNDPSHDKALEAYELEEPQKLQDLPRAIEPKQRPAAELPTETRIEEAYKDDGNSTESSSSSSREEGEISEPETPSVPPPPRINLAKIVKASFQKAKPNSRPVSRAGSQFGRSEGNPIQDLKRQRLRVASDEEPKSIKKPICKKPAEHLEDQAAQNKAGLETISSPSPTDADPVRLTTTSEVQAQEALAAAVAREPNHDDLKEWVPTIGLDSVQVGSNDGERLAPATDRILSEHNQDLQMNDRKALALPSPNPISNPLNLPSQKLGDSLATTSSSVCADTSDQVTSTESPEVAQKGVILTEDMIANNPSLLKLMEQSDRLLEMVLPFSKDISSAGAGSMTVSHDGTMELSPTSNISSRSNKHRDSTSSIDSPPPITPPTIPTQQLFFVNPEDTIGFDIKDVPLFTRPVEIPDFSSDKMADDIDDDDDFWATHQLEYPE